MVARLRLPANGRGFDGGTVAALPMAATMPGRTAARPTASTMPGRTVAASEPLTGTDAANGRRFDGGTVAALPMVARTSGTVAASTIPRRDGIGQRSRTAGRYRPTVAASTVATGTARTAARWHGADLSRPCRWWRQCQGERRDGGTVATSGNPAATNGPRAASLSSWAADAATNALART